ncbi:MAG: HD domain-containing protein [Puniceicoccaceae bacterium]|nr:MAG: HD domain-containing protein [Puniceicoccaceae bacterium]
MDDPTASPTIAGLTAAPPPDGGPFQLRAVIRKVEQRTTKTQKPFLVVEFADTSGTLSTNCFDNSPLFSFFQQHREGTIVDLSGQGDSYQGRFAPRLTEATVVPANNLSEEELARLVEQPPEPVEALKTELREHVLALENPSLRAVVESVFSDAGPAFFTCPAAINMHHAYPGGLLEHTVRMARACRALLPLYPEVHHDLALAGILLHDIGKIDEYEGGLAVRHSVAGVLQGHIVLGYQRVRRAGIKERLDASLLQRLEHIILSHQGEPEWGAAARAATAEAVFVSMVDNLDAKMGMVQHLLRNRREGAVLSDRHPGLRTSLLLTEPEPETGG